MLKFILLIILAVILIVGICRLLFGPVSGFWDCFMKLFLLDYIGDILEAVAASDFDMDDDD